MYVSTKNYGPEQGFSVCYRQWRAQRKSGKSSGVYTSDEVPGCCALHGYSLGFYFEFESPVVDVRNWVVSFSDLRPLKDFLANHFDHTMLVSEDDPELRTFERLHEAALCKLVVVEKTGCEGLSKFLYDYINDIFLPDHGFSNIHCRLVKITETPANCAWYEESWLEWQERIAGNCDEH